MKYEEAMKYITEVGNFGSNYGLERTYKLLEFLGNPEKDKLKANSCSRDKWERFYNFYDYCHVNGMWL